jgi:hypothetical protein
VQRIGYHPRLETQSELWTECYASVSDDSLVKSCSVCAVENGKNGPCERHVARLHHFQSAVWPFRADDGLRLLDSGGSCRAGWESRLSVELCCTCGTNEHVQVLGDRPWITACRVVTMRCAMDGDASDAGSEYTMRRRMATRWCWWGCVR